ncbi:MAG: hypothetical protein R2909_14850 [Gemmatimonadales bacterium]
MRPTAAIRLELALLASVASASLLSAQTDFDRPAIAGVIGLGFGGPDADDGGMLGVELRVPVAGRVSASIGASRWGFVVGCDLIIGASCDDTAWAGDLTVAARLTPRRTSWELAIAASVGRLVYTSDRGVWKPSVAIETRTGLGGPFGWQIGLAYHVFAGSRLAGQPYQPRSANLVVVRTGLHVRM